MKAIIYRRTSREDKDDKMGLERQKSQIYSYLNNHPDLEVIKDISVDGLSGTIIEENQKLQELLNSLDKIDAVIVSEIDRLIRPKDFASLAILDGFTRGNTLIITPTKTYDLSNYQDQLFMTIQAGFANYEMNVIKTRMLEGKKKKLEQGHTGAGRPYCGYRWDKEKNMFVFTDDIHKIKTIVDMILKDFSLRVIADKVGMSPVTISRIGRATILYGEIINRLKGEEYIIKAEPLMTKTEWQVLQNKLNERSKRYPGGRKKYVYTYLLQGLLINENGKSYYCSTHRYRGVTYYSNPDTKKYYRCSDVDKKVFDYLKQHQELYRKTYNEQIKKEEKQDLKEKLLYYEKEILNIDKRLNRLKDLYIDGDIDKKEYNKRKVKLNTEKSAMVSNRLDVSNKIKNQTINNVVTLYLLEHLGKLETLSFEEQRRLLFSVIDKIVFDDQNVLSITLKIRNRMI